jgi:hypothetical protein
MKRWRALLTEALVCGTLTGAAWAQPPRFWWPGQVKPGHSYGWYEHPQYNWKDSDRDRDRDRDWKKDHDHDRDRDRHGRNDHDRDDGYRYDRYDYRGDRH